MEILNSTKQQYISQNYVILQPNVHVMQYALPGVLAESSSLLSFSVPYPSIIVFFK